MTWGTILNGILVGGVYALLALGMSLVFGVLRIVNLAHGELVVGGAYVAFLCVSQFSMSTLAALPVAVAAAAIIGYALQRGLLTGLLSRGGGAVIVATFGLSILFRGVFIEAAGSSPKSLPGSLGSTGTSIFGTEVRTVYVVGFLISAALFLATHLALQRTRIGWNVRAAAADPATASLMGLNVKRIYAATFAVSAALAAVGGVVLGIAYSVTPTTGPQYLLIAIAVVVVGGVGSVGGTFLGGLLLGLLQSEAVLLFGGQYRDLAVYLAFFLLLAVRPHGLFGRRFA